MGRVEFISELNMLLMDLPDEERVSAIQYYDDYFADAGVEEEEKVIQELGSPEKIAASIKADYYGTEFHEEEFDDKKYPEKYKPGRDAETEQEGSANQNRYAWENQNAQYQDAGQQGYGGDQSRTEYQYGYDARQNGAGRESGGAWQQNHSQYQPVQKKPWTNKWLKLILIILIAICLVPTAGGILLGVLGTIFGVACAVVAACAGLVVAAVAIAIAGIGVIIFGMTLVFSFAPTALVVIGAGLILLALGLAATAGTVKLCMVVYPAMVRGCVKLCKMPFRRKAV